MIFSIRETLLGEVKSNICRFITKQENDYYCGPAIAQAILKSFEIEIDQGELALKLKTNDENGTDNEELVRVLQDFGLKVETKDRASVADVKRGLSLDKRIVVNYKEKIEEEGHFGIVHSVDIFSIKIHDPWNGLVVKFRLKDFESRWESGFQGHQNWMMMVSK